MKMLTDSEKRAIIILIICTICALLTYILPWGAIDLVAREQLTVWNLAFVLGHVPEYLSIGNYGLASTLLYLFSGLAVIVLVFDLVNTILLILGKKTGVTLNNPSMIITICFPVLFIAWFLEAEFASVLNTELTLWPLISAIICLVGLSLKIRIDNALTKD